MIAFKCRQGIDTMSAHMNIYLLASTVCFAAWVIIAFVIAWPTGWAHAPLIVAVVLLARAIVGTAKTQ